MGEDQHPAGLGGLDEAEGGDRLAGAGGVLEPEALGGVRVLGLLGQRLLFLALLDPVAGLVAVAFLLGLLGRLLVPVDLGAAEQLPLELVLVLFLLVREPRGPPARGRPRPRPRPPRRRRARPRPRRAPRRPRGPRPPRAPRAAPLAPAGSSGPRIAADASSSGEADPLARPLPPEIFRCSSASSAVSVPDRASTWWAERAVPSVELRLVLGDEPVRAPSAARTPASRPWTGGCAWGPPRARPGRGPGRPGVACRGRAPGRDPRPRAGSARGRAFPPARYRQNLGSTRPVGPLRRTRPCGCDFGRLGRAESDLRRGLSARRRGSRTVCRTLTAPPAVM